MDSRWLVAWGVGSVALGAASLLVPLYVVALGGGALALGALAALAAFAGVPGALVAGRITDRTGRRHPFVVGSLAAVAASLAAVAALSSIAAVVAVNAVVWLAFAAAAPALNLLVVAGADESDWSARLASLNAYQGYGWAGGLLLGLVWTAGGARFIGGLLALRSLAVACGAVAGAAAVAAALTLPPESAGRGVRSRELGRALRRAPRTGIRGATFPVYPARLYWGLRRFRLGRFSERFTPALATYYLAVVFFFTGFAAFFAPLPLFLTDAGFGGGEVFAMYLLSSVGAAVFFTRAGRLVARYDVASVHALGLVVRAGALPAVAVVAGRGAVAITGVVFVLIGLTWAIIAVSAATVVTRLAPAAVRGEALGVYAALASLAGGLGSVLGGWLAGRSYLLAFGVAGALVAGAAALVVVAGRRSGRANPGAGGRAEAPATDP